jgi:UDP:flavonoid glycosyltransferase YjiC (YdhE family)
MSKETQAGPLVSVVMSTYAEINMPAPSGMADSMLSHAIGSVVAQTYPNWELRVVSDHPPDQLRNEIEMLIASYDDDRIHYEDLPSRGGATAPGVKPKLCGVKRSTGELLAFLDADNAFEPDHLAHCTRAFAECESGLDMVYCDTHVVYAGQTDTDDLLRKAVDLPYHFLGAVYGEKFSGELRKHVLPPVPIGPLTGAPFVWKKPDWNERSAKKLQRFNFVDTSDAVMTRAAYEAAGGIQEIVSLDWQLWRAMIHAGRGRFRHISHVGVRYSTGSLTQHREYYALSLFETLDLPVNLANISVESIRDREGHYLRKHPVWPNHPAANRPPRVLFMAEAAAISHVARPFLLARHLNQAGYEVCLARDPRYSKLFLETAFNVVDLESLPGAVVMKRLANQEPIYDFATIDRYVQADLEVLRKFKPDIVVGDQRHSLAISSRLTHTRYINIADGQWSPSAEAEYTLTDSPISERLGMPLANLIFQFIHPVAFAFQTLPLNLVRLKYGLPGIGPDIQSCFTYGDHTVYANDPGLFRLKKPLPPGHMFIGPLLWSPAVEKPEWWDKLPEDGSLVYVSLGSTGQPGLLKSIFGVLGKLPITVLAATAARGETEAIPSNVYIADFLPGTEAAQRSRLVICNGGTMSGQQALSAGTPFLGLVSNMDQMLYSQAVRQTGACELMRESEVNESALRPVISGMLGQERYRTSAKMLAERTAKLDACREFEELVNSILKKRVRTRTPESNAWAYSQQTNPSDADRVPAG